MGWIEEDLYPFTNADYLLMNFYGLILIFKHQSGP